MGNEKTAGHGVCSCGACQPAQLEILRLTEITADLLAALQRVGCQDKGSCGTDEVDGPCFVCRAIETAVRS